MYWICSREERAPRCSRGSRLPVRASGHTDTRREASQQSSRRGSSSSHPVHAAERSKPARTVSKELMAYHRGSSGLITATKRKEKKKGTSDLLTRGIDGLAID